MELRYYRHMIGIDFSDLCGCGVAETIIHVLCECVSTEEARRRNWHEAVTPSMLTTHPDITRRILATKYWDLQLPAKMLQNNNTQTTEDCNDVVVELPARAVSAFAGKFPRTKKKTTTAQSAIHASFIRASHKALYCLRYCSSSISTA